MSHPVLRAAWKLKWGARRGEGGQLGQVCGVPGPGQGTGDPLRGLCQGGAQSWQGSAVRAVGTHLPWGCWLHIPGSFALIKTANTHLVLLKPSRSGKQLWCSKKNSRACRTEHSCHEEATWAEFKAASRTKVICSGYSSAELSPQFSPKTSSQSIIPKAAQFKSIHCAACHCHHWRLGELEAYKDESDFQR